MERTISELETEELIEIVNQSLFMMKNNCGHLDEGYCLACDDEPFEALKEIKKRFEQRPNWPLDIFNQYITALDERDYIQEKFDDASEFLLERMSHELHR